MSPGVALSVHQWRTSHELIQHRHRTRLLLPTPFNLSRRAQPLRKLYGIDDLLKRVQVFIAFLQCHEQLPSLLCSWFRHHRHRCRHSFQTHQARHQCRRSSEVLRRVYGVWPPYLRRKCGASGHVARESSEIIGGFDVFLLLVLWLHWWWGSFLGWDWGFLFCWRRNHILFLLLPWTFWNLLISERLITIFFFSNLEIKSKNNT